MRWPRVAPIPVTLALTAAALLATAWTMRRTVARAFDAVREGQAIGLAQAVRADVAEVAPLRGGAPTTAELATIIAEHGSEGLTYVGVLTATGDPVVASGTAVGSLALPRLARSHITVLADRVRVEMRLGRRAYGERGAVLALELEPAEANALQRASSTLLVIGGIASLILLAVAFGLIRRELIARAGAAARERQQRLASLGEMSAVLAHEIRNPLASLKGNAQLLSASLVVGDPERTKAKAQRVVDDAVRLENLTRDLLAFVATGELARQDVDVGELLRDAASTGDDVVQITCASDLRWSLDASRMRSALTNVIENAVNAGPPVAVTARVQGSELVIEISDHGPGVPNADRARIFEPFHTTKTHGTGLGLAVTRRIIEAHRGTIKVGEAASSGAVFKIAIPR